jgi:predicted transposase/invertase (TIGR01784 family)
MEQAAYTKAQLAAYDKWKLAAMTERSIIKDSKREGKIEGKIEGKMEKALEIAVKMLKKGAPIEDICDYTELSQEQIEQLKNSL